MNYIKRMKKNKKNKCKHEWRKENETAFDTNLEVQIYDYYICNKCQSKKTVKR